MTVLFTLKNIEIVIFRKRDAMEVLGSVEYKRRAAIKLSIDEKRVNKIVDCVLKRAKTPNYVIADDYSNIRIVLAHGVKYTMKTNGYVWDTSSRCWVPFYRILFDI